MYIGAVHCALLLLVIHCRIPQVWCRTTALTSVTHDFSKRPRGIKKGILITSFSYHKKDDRMPLQPPPWVGHYLQAASSFSATAAALPLQCYFEMLGVLDYPRGAEVGNINGTARLSQPHWTRSVSCKYRTTFAKIALEGESITLAYYCPVFEASVCVDAATFSKGVKYVNYDLVTRRDFQEFETEIKVNIHHDAEERASDAAASRTDSDSEVAVAVCLVFPYPSSDRVQKGILVENIRWYHEVLGFKVILYDHGGAHYELLAAKWFFRGKLSVGK